MPVQPIVEELGRVDEPTASPAFSEALTRVAADHQPIIVRRGGEDLAAVVPLEHLELIREALARQEAESLASQINWNQVAKDRRPPQSWFDDEDNPFEPEETPAP